MYILSPQTIFMDAHKSNHCNECSRNDWDLLDTHSASGPVLSAFRVLTQSHTITPVGLVSSWPPPYRHTGVQSDELACCMSHGHDAAELAFPLSLASAPILLLSRVMNSKHRQGRCSARPLGRGPLGRKEEQWDWEGREGTSTHPEFLFLRKKLKYGKLFWMVEICTSNHSL